MSLREDKKRAQRHRILEVCGKLFRSRGFDETTIDDIVVDVGISRQTFFNYFPSKEWVLRELGMEWLALQARQSLERQDAHESGDLMPRLRELLVGQLRAMEADREFMTLVFTRSGLFFPTGSDIGTPDDAVRIDRTRGAFTVIAAGVRTAQERGELRPDVDPFQVAEIYVAIFYVTSRLWLTNYWGKQEALEERIFAAIDIMMNGLRPKD